MFVCYIDGVWGAWQEWGECPVECGGGRRARNRVCDSDSTDCVGFDTQEERCNVVLCPITGSLFLKTLYLNSSKKKHILGKNINYSNHPPPFNSFAQINT